MKDETILNIAKTLFMYHQEETEWDECMERMWSGLNMKRDWNDPYTVAQDEYYRMAKGIMVLINKELYNHYENISYD